MTTAASHTHSCQRSEDDGATWIEFGDLVEGFSTHHGYQADRGTASINCADYPAGLAVNQLIVLYIDGDLVFNGRVARPALHYYGNSVVIECEDVMANLSFPWGGEGTDPELDALFNRVYTSQTDGAVITNLCEAMAVPVSLHDIQDSGWTLGTIYDVVLRVGQTALQLVRQIDEIACYWTASRNNGAITRRPIAVGTADFTATEGVNIISADRTPQGTESIINRYIVYGFEYEGAAIGGIGVGDYSLTNSNIPTPPTSHTGTVRSNLVESDADALAAATRLVGLHNFPYDETNLTVLGDTGVTIGQTIQIDSAELDHAGDSTSLRFAAEVSHRYGVGVGFETQIKCIRTE